MKKLVKYILAFLLIAIAIFTTSFFVEQSKFEDWEIKLVDTSAKEISWAKFIWANDSLGNKYYERTSMHIPCKLEGISNTCFFQFDLGADLSGVYEVNFSSFYNHQPKLKENIKRLRSPLQFWHQKKYFSNLKINFGNYLATNTKAFVFANYGNTVNIENSTDTIHLGTIGADLFKDKILIIDYPNQQFAICDRMPNIYSQIHFTDISLDKHNRVILPMLFKNKTYNVLFDNGSSIFPLITQVKNIDNFSNASYTDTIQVSSWGKLHNVTGRLIKDSFLLAGQSFGNTMIYANHSGSGIDKTTDAMAGNALFWNKTIIINFKEKKFGVW